MANFGRIGFCWNVSWNVRWFGSPCGGAPPGTGRSAPNGNVWLDTWMLRLAGEPRRNGSRVFALSSAAARPPGVRSITSGVSCSLVVAVGSCAVSARRAAALPWLANSMR